MSDPGERRLSGRTANERQPRRPPFELLDRFDEPRRPVRVNTAQMACEIDEQLAQVDVGRAGRRV